MLLCGIINEISALTSLKDKNATTLLSFFFCQATDSRINNATAVLRGLIYLLINQQPSLILHLRKRYDHAGKALFEDENAWVALSAVFKNILQDQSLKDTYLIIDGLDECVIGLRQLLYLIDQTSSTSPCVKWIVSSRNWPNIAEYLEPAIQTVPLCLELNVKSVSDAVGIFIQHRVDKLAHLKNYNRKTHNVIKRYLSANADNTFLWVALVCHELEKIEGLVTGEKLKAFPPGLYPLYQRMMEQVCSSDSADLCKQILSVVAVAYRPITMDELTSFIGMPEDISDVDVPEDMSDVDVPEDTSDDFKSLKKVIGLCGSFLTLRERIITFVHQSAKEYLLNNASDKIFLSGKDEVHYVMFSRSLQVMSKTLKRDIYNLRAPGISIDQVKQPNPDPLAAARYSCLYWVNHLLDCDTRENTINDLKDSGLVHNFLCQHFLFWLEALSLIRSLSDGIRVIRKLENWLQVSFFSNIIPPHL
jgi:hypothetical protein